MVLMVPSFPRGRRSSTKHLEFKKKTTYVLKFSIILILSSSYYALLDDANVPIILDHGQRYCNY